MHKLVPSKLSEMKKWKIDSGGPVALPDFLGLCGGARPSNQSRTFLDFQGRDAAAAPRAHARLPVASVSSWAGQRAVGSVAQLSPAQVKIDGVRLLPLERSKKRKKNS